MNVPVNAVYLAAAVLPVVFLFAAILILGWGVSKAAPAGLLISLILAIGLFKTTPAALLFEAVKGIWNAASILLVIWPAVFTYELIDSEGGFQAIRRGIQALTRHELLQILILGWIFPSFLQGITGFGVAVAVGAPLLLSIGVKPLYSIVIVLLCHVWGATFGTLALAWDALMEQTAMNAAQSLEAAVMAAAMIWAFNLVCVIICSLMYGGRKALREGLPVILLLSVITGGGELILVQYNTTVACFLPSAAAMAVVLALSRTKRYSRLWKADESNIMERRKDDAGAGKVMMSMHQAFLPYYVLTGITVFCLLIPPVNRLLGSWMLGLSFPETVTGYGFVTKKESFFSPIKPLTYAGTFLVLSALVSMVYYRSKNILKHSTGLILRKTVKKCISPTVAIICLIVMSKFMNCCGMIYILSHGVVSILGRYYVIAAPFFGMLGAFITSSNMSSNILMGGFQNSAAVLLNINPAVTAALQTVGGILGNAFAPGCVIMGMSTTGFDGGEVLILKRIMPVSLCCGFVFGLCAVLILV